MKTTLVMILIAALSGCCTYHGKIVSKKRAEEMRKLGMDVRCPN